MVSAKNSSKLEPAFFLQSNKQYEKIMVGKNDKQGVNIPCERERERERERARARER